MRNTSEIEKNLMKMQCCVTPCGQTDIGSSQKTYVCGVLSDIKTLNVTYEY